MKIEITQKKLQDNIIQIAKEDNISNSKVVEKSVEIYKNRRAFHKPFKKINSSTNTEERYAINIRDASFNTQAQFRRLCKHLALGQSELLQMLMSKYESKGEL